MSIGRFKLAVEAMPITDNLWDTCILKSANKKSTKEFKPKENE